MYSVAFIQDGVTVAEGLKFLGCPASDCDQTL